MLKIPSTKSGALRGAVAVEFALLLIPLLIMIVGVAEYGRALFQYNTITKSVRDSVRYLSQQNPHDADYPLQAARCMTVFGNINCAGDPLVPGLTVDMVRVCNPVDATACPGWAYSAVGTGFGSVNLVEVKVVGYQFETFLPLVPGAGLIAFSDIHMTMRQVL